jgi:serine/threonine protein kinase
MPEHAVDEKVIFLAALEQASQPQREAYIQGACAGEPELLNRVKELLSVHQESQGPLDAPPPGVGIPATIDEPAVTERPGTVIGPYKLLEQIGEGGFGVVFMAEQTHPVRRKVALKVLKPGMDTRQVVARFEAERQALALMDHPNIAHVFDGGETASARPYFVMELVRGTPITDFCDQNQLPVRERLELFVNVCQAVQHAHQKGIIHRDLKPTNVMVAMHDDKPADWHAALYVAGAGRAEQPGRGYAQ